MRRSQSEFALRGCRVAITARDLERLGTVADKMAQNGAQVRAIACDVTHREQVRRLRHSIRELWGDVQILVNNAGIARAVSFADMSDETWDQTLDTNLTGAYNCCKVFLPAMVEAKWGRIINIASTTAKVGYSHVTAYTASKHGLLGLTRSLALETGRIGVTVNAICPGYIDDERTRDNARIMADKTGKSVDDILKAFRVQRAAEAIDRSRRSRFAGMFNRGAGNERHDRSGDQCRRRRGDGVNGITRWGIGVVGGWRGNCHRAITPFGR